MRTNLPTVEQPLMFATYKASSGLDVIPCQNSNCLLGSSSENKLDTSQGEISKRQNVLSQSSLLSCYARALQTCSIGIISTALEESGLSLVKEHAIMETSLEDDSIPFGTYDDSSEFDNDIEMDDISSILSEQNSSIGTMQDDTFFDVTTQPALSTLFRINPGMQTKTQRVDQVSETWLETEASRLQNDMPALKSTYERLQECMLQSSLTQASLQEWDRLNGLPASHSRTMVNTSRSRKQLQDGVVLRKWDGSPLVTLSAGSQ